MVCNQIYHDLIIPMLCWIKWLWNGLPILQLPGLWCGCAMGRSSFKTGSIAKQVGTALPFISHEVTPIFSMISVAWHWIVYTVEWRISYQFALLGYCTPWEFLLNFPRRNVFFLAKTHFFQPWYTSSQCHPQYTSKALFLLIIYIIKEQHLWCNNNKVKYI